jgi:hypothetical protein
MWRYGNNSKQGGLPPRKGVGKRGGKMKKPKCDCHLHKNQVCDICQGVTGKELDKKVANGEYGYHMVAIKKGEMGRLSKIQEELDELKDAEEQGVRILVGCELADLYGAMEAYAAKWGLSMHDLCDMAKLTKFAFEKGYR